MALIVHSSHGDIEIDSQGFVTHRSGDPEYAGVFRFDLAEYAKAYPADPAPSEFDILDLGYWYHDSGAELYEPPEADFRAEVARHLAEAALPDDDEPLGNPAGVWPCSAR